MVSPVQKALWFIESHSAGDIGLDDVAECAGVSRFHLSRAFAAATGVPIMRYLRGRRLTRAAKSLADGADDILSVALEAGYGSHEAFTRAFRDQFGTTPDAIRKQGDLQGIELLEAIRMADAPRKNLSPPRFEQLGTLLIAGIAEHNTANSSAAGIPAQWQRFVQHMGHISGQRGSLAYGVVHNTDDEGSMDYLAGVEVADFDRMPGGFSALRVPERRYAVFRHEEHVSSVRATWSAIWNQWLPESGHKVADAPLLERYDEKFDPRSGQGGVDLMVPLAS
jgi:AraC family transcriptional regulator